MNGNPSKKQQNFQDELRMQGCIVTGAFQVEIHHIMGSKFKAKIFDEIGDKVPKPGEWLVITLYKEVHDNIKDYSFDAERGLFLASLRRYEFLTGKRHPVPEEVITYYKAMKHRQDVPSILFL